MKLDGVVVLSYRKGRRFEWEVRRMLESRGWLTIRVARSKPLDLIALKNGSILLIECKYSSRISEKDKSRMIEMAKITAGKPILALRKKYERRIHLVNLENGEQFNP